MRKIALLAATLMITMAVSGFAYAYWTDQLIVEGEINTGTFGWELSYSGTEMAGDTKGVVDFFGAALKDDDGDGIMQKLRFEIDNFYPGVKAQLAWDIHFYGSVPGHIEEGGVTWTLTVDDGSGPVCYASVPEWLYLGFRVQSFSYSGVAPSYIGDGPVPDAGIGGTSPNKNPWLSLEAFCDYIDNTQWHECNVLDIETWIELVEPGMEYNPAFAGSGPIPFTDPNTEPPQGAKIVLTITIDGVQYNYSTGVSPPTLIP